MSVARSPTRLLVALLTGRRRGALHRGGRATLRGGRYAGRRGGCGPFGRSGPGAGARNTSSATTSTAATATATRTTIFAERSAGRARSHVAARTGGFARRAAGLTFGMRTASAGRSAFGPRTTGGTGAAISGRALDARRSWTAVALGTRRSWTAVALGTRRPGSAIGGRTFGTRRARSAIGGRTFGTGRARAAITGRAVGTGRPRSTRAIGTGSTGATRRARSAIAGRAVGTATLGTAATGATLAASIAGILGSALQHPAHARGRNLGARRFALHSAALLAARAGLAAEDAAAATATATGLAASVAALTGLAAPVAASGPTIAAGLRLGEVVDEEIEFALLLGAHRCGVFAREHAHAKHRFEARAHHLERLEQAGESVSADVDAGGDGVGPRRRSGGCGRLGRGVAGPGLRCRLGAVIAGGALVRGAGFFWGGLRLDGRGLRLDERGLPLGRSGLRVARFGRCSAGLLRRCGLACGRTVFLADARRLANDAAGKLGDGLHLLLLVRRANWVDGAAHAVNGNRSSRCGLLAAFSRCSRRDVSESAPRPSPNSAPIVRLWCFA